MGFIKEWQDKLGVKIVCSQVRAADNRLASPASLPCVPALPPMGPTVCAGPPTPVHVLLPHASSVPMLCCAVLCCGQEKEPMGTAGPLALARDLLDDGSGKPFFVLNRCVWATRACVV
jgi:hypothetical protein